MSSNVRDFQSPSPPENETSPPPDGREDRAESRPTPFPAYPPTLGTGKAPTLGRSATRSTVASQLRFRGRSDTVKTYQPPNRPNWQPGAEPGIDTSKDSEKDVGLYKHQTCEITLVDYSADRIEQRELDNESLEDCLNSPRANWVECRWICVNGLSWDVVKLLGNHKGLHRLAVEDLIEGKHRAKADW